MQWRLGQTINDPVPAWPIAAFRIVFSLVVLRDIAELYNQRNFLWPPGFHASPWTPAPWMLAIWAAALVFTILGLGTRPAAIVNLAATIAVLAPSRSGGNYLETADTMLFLGAWLLVLLPTDACWALTRKRHSRFVPGLVHLVAGVVLCTIYLDSGLRKLASPMWRAGLGIWAPASLPEAVLGRMPGLDSHALMLAIGWGIILWEVSFAFVWFLVPRLRPVVWGIGIAFHLGGLFFFPFRTFSLAMLAFQVLATPPEIANRLGRLRRQAPGELQPLWIRREILIGAIVFWLALHLVVLADLGAGAGSLRARVAARASKTLYPVIGLTGYGVFDDSLFRDQRYQIDVVFGSGDDCASPIVHSRDGFNSTELDDRLWERWFKRTQAPRIPLATSEADLIEWARTVRTDPTGARIIARRQTPVLTEWQPGLLKKNLRENWVEIGRINGSRGNKPSITWSAPRTRTTLVEEVLASLDHPGPAVERNKCRNVG